MELPRGNIMSAALACTATIWQTLLSLTSYLEVSVQEGVQRGVPPLTNRQGVHNLES